MEQSTISKLANSTFTSQFFQAERQDNQQSLVAIKNNRVQVLHAMITPEQIAPRQSNNKPLLLHAAFHNSSSIALYLLRKGGQLNDKDQQGRTVFHVCAYTGHLQVFRTIRNHIKLMRIKALNQKYLEFLAKNNYKRTDMKGGQLKMSVSEGRRKVFEKMQADITATYKQYALELMQDTFNAFMTPLANNNHNCFHQSAINKYRKCSSIFEAMLQELSDINLHLDNEILTSYQQVNGCFPHQKDKLDPRMYEDTIALIEQVILPTQLQTMRKYTNDKIQEQVQKILETRDVDGQTPLHIASKDGSTAIINLIRKWQSHKLKKGEQKEDLIKIACHNLARSHIMDLCDASKQADSKTMNFLLSCGEEINKKKTIFGTFALLQAIKAYEVSKKIEPIRILILSGADVNEQDTNGWTVLHHACDRGLKQPVDQIFKIWQQGKSRKIQINKLTNKNYHILHLAAMSNHPQMINFLLTSPTAKKLEINSNAIDGDKCTILHQAARRGSTQALKVILELSPDLIYELDIRHNTALHYASMNDHIACIRYLLYFDSDYDKLQQIKNTRGKLARDLNVNKKPFDNIFTAARSGDVNQVRKMICENPSYKAIVTPGKNRSLLILAVINKHLLVVKYLIELGVDQSQQDKAGKTAKVYAQQSLSNAKSKQEQVLAKNIRSLLA